MSDGPDNAADKEREMREHEEKAREHSSAEARDDGLDESNSAPPGNAGTGTVSGGS